MLNRHNTEITRIEKTNFSAQMIDDTTERSIRSKWLYIFANSAIQDLIFILNKYQRIFKFAPANLIGRLEVIIFVFLCEIFRFGRSSAYWLFHPLHFILSCDLFTWIRDSLITIELICLSPELLKSEPDFSRCIP